MQFALLGMIALAVGGIVYVFAMPLLSGERRAAKRVRSVTSRADLQVQRGKGPDGVGRRKLVQETLKELEGKRKNLKKRPRTKDMIAQAGFTFQVRSFYIAGLALGLVVALGLFLVSGGLLLPLGGAFVAGFGLPRWFLSFMRKRRHKKFLEDFPNAIDIVVRGVKAGLPLNDTLRTIAAESAEPVRSEFREVIEAQAFGLPIAEALQRMHERVPLPEVNFLVIVVNIQSQSGGNLAEALGNLSRVLRERKRLNGKIQSMSQEAKASAAIIAALPLAVMILVYVTTPAYISLLWQRDLGHIMLAASAFWMTSGVLVMRKMINFDF
jgi:tight adherence protein B